MSDVFDNLYEEVVVREQDMQNNKVDLKKIPFSMKMRDMRWDLEEMQEHHQWEFKEKPLLEKMLKNIKESRTDAFYSLDNSKEVNDEIYIHNIQVVNDKKKELLEGVLASGDFSYKLAKIWRTIKIDLDLLSGLCRDARAVRADNLQLKQYLANPEKIAKMPYLQIRSPLTSESLKELKFLEKRYFSDSPMEQGLKGIEDIVAENEKMYRQIIEKWRQFDRQKSLFQDMNQRLDGVYGNESREQLSDITNRALQDRENVNDRSTKTEGVKERLGAKREKWAPEL
ncbi:MAG: hypothetical protein ACOX2N_05995 [Peptococcia bacterium]|jgi:hypothetical protein